MYIRHCHNPDIFGFTGPSLGAYNTKGKFTNHVYKPKDLKYLNQKVHIKINITLKSVGIVTS
jgi:hypothetical protein